MRLSDLIRKTRFALIRARVARQRGRTHRLRPLPSRLVWVDDPHDHVFDFARVDDLECEDCGEAIGWWADADDTGRTIGGFQSYGATKTGDRLWCEDCYPGQVV